MGLAYFTGERYAFFFTTLARQAGSGHRAGHVLGDTRIRLLEAIAKHGSISQAAKAVPLS